MITDETHFTCWFCNGDATEEMPLAQVFTAGTFFYHWNFTTNQGCDKNVKNTHPWTGEEMPRILVEHGKNYDGNEKGCFTRSLDKK